MNLWYRIITIQDLCSFPRSKWGRFPFHLLPCRRETFRPPPPCSGPCRDSRCHHSGNFRQSSPKCLSIGGRNPIPYLKYFGNGKVIFYNLYFFWETSYDKKLLFVIPLTVLLPGAIFLATSSSSEQNSNAFCRCCRCTCSPSFITWRTNLQRTSSSRWCEGERNLGI